MPCPILLACDSSYAMPLATVLRSIVDANSESWPIEFYVLTDGMPDGTQKKIFDSLPNNSATIRWIPSDLARFRGFATLKWVSTITYARLLIPDVLPDHVSKVLYLDVDMLVLGSLKPLWEIDLDGAVVGAVLDCCDPRLKRNEKGFENVPRVKDYFNAGVLLINVDAWRKTQMCRKALSYITDHPQTPYSDQDALNVACDGQWKQLDSKWNFHEHHQVRVSELDPVRKPTIVHFIGVMKPWDANIPNLNAKLYDEIRGKTRFARTAHEKFHDQIRTIWAHCKHALRQIPLLDLMAVKFRQARMRIQEQ